jgi:hypothetical protein
MLPKSFVFFDKVKTCQNFLFFPEIFAMILAIVVIFVYFRKKFSLKDENDFREKAETDFFPQP